MPQRVTAAAQFIADKIAELGFNCVRLPWALDTVFEGGGASEDGRINSLKRLAWFKSKVLSKSL